MTERREPTVELSLRQALGWAAWGCLTLGVVLLILGLFYKDVSYLAAGCFLGIVSRIFQAERQHRELL